MTTPTIAAARIFTRADGRERIEVPFWSGILSTAGAVAIGFVCGVIGTIVLIVGVVLATGRTPSDNPAHPLVQLSGLAMYAGAGAFAVWRLRKLGRPPLLQPLSARDVRAIGLGVAALLLVRIGTLLQLIATHQTKHVQSGFEHFDVMAKTPALTAVTAAVALFAIVVAGPIVEEIVFRGLLFGALAGPLGVIGGALVSALVFGISHGDPVLFPSLAALGFLSAIAYAATGNLSVSAALHALNNALGAAFLVAGSLAHR